MCRWRRQWIPRPLWHTADADKLPIDFRPPTKHQADHPCVCHRSVRQPAVTCPRALHQMVQFLTLNCQWQYLSLPPPLCYYQMFPGTHTYTAHARFTVLVIAAHEIWQAFILFLPSGFFSFYLSTFFFSRLISATADWMSIILPHMVWP